MMLMRRRLSCCSKDREISIDFDEQDGVMMYNGRETSVIINQSYEEESVTSKGDGCLTDSFDDDAYSSCSSSKDAFGSVSSKWLPATRGKHGCDDWEFSESPQHFYVKDKPAYSLAVSDVEAMKEKFSKLLLGEDVTGGHKGVQTALALSNAITNLAASVFGELWKLEPLSEEKKNKWRREMDWLLSPTNHMIELVPSKQNCANGRTVEIMTPKARADIHINLPALQKLDSMLIAILDSMINTEFWYAEVGSRAERRNKSTRESKRWWLPSPQVPKPGLSKFERKKLFDKGKLVYQVFKAVKSINENVLLEMPMPNIIREAVPKSGKTNLGDELHRLLEAESRSVDEIISSLNLGTQNNALETVNRLETAIFAWKERIAEHAISGKSPVRTSWSFKKDPLPEIGRLELFLDRAQALKQEIKLKFPNLPQSFLDSTKIQYGKDIGHAILEAYSRVLANLAYSILSRMGEILQEDALSNPNSPVPLIYFPGIIRSPETPDVISSRVRHSLIDRMNNADGTKEKDSENNRENVEFPSDDSRAGSVSASSRNRVWCMNGEGCIGKPMGTSP